LASPARNLRVLIVEDSPDDAALLLREIGRGGFETQWVRVETANDFTRALESRAWDLIVSDFHLPAFSAPKALALVKQSELDIPFIVISGTVNEQIAIDALKAGASDFMSKNNLARLLPAIDRELREASSRRERARAIEALRESEERYRVLFDTNPFATFIFDVETLRFVEVNEAALQRYGYARQRFLSMTLQDLWPSYEMAAPEAERARTGPDVQKYVAVHHKSDGTPIDVEVSSHPFLFAGKAARVSVVNDVTERKQLEEQLRQSQKMEAVGQLAGGIAHDFNNILAVITGYAELLLADLDGEDPRRADVVEIETAARRATSLTHQLLAFSRRQVLQPAVLEVNAVIRNLEKMLRRIIGEHIEFSLVLEPTLGRVKVDPGQLEQVLLNLVVNARDAMPRGGKLVITTSNERRTESGGDAPDFGRHYIVIGVSDTGIGMDRETQTRIFEPFFTTKEVGKGTGLGLSTVYGITSQSGGHVTVDSEPGRGTTFHISLPRVEEALTPSEAPRALRRSSPAWETILVVEDDRAVRNVTCRILRQIGYSVLDAGDPDRAREICVQHAGTVHLLLTDIIMPKKSGPDLALELTLLQPAMKVLYMSGYTGGAPMQQSSFPEGISFLEKPFTPEALMRAVRLALETARSAEG
jgi:two-component system cell cycle sensor histidine kinase/response regulator CckA